MSLRKKTISGFKWMTIQQIVVQASSFIFGIILMRLLEPEDFGLVAMVMVFTGLMGVFKDFGITASLIQKKGIAEVDKQVVFWVMVGIGLFLSTLLFFGAPLIANFYNESAVTNIAKWMSISFLINALGSVSFTLLRKELNFKPIAITSLITVPISGGVAVILAMMDFAYWAIVVQSIMITNIPNLIIFFYSDFKPKLIFNKDILKEHLNFGLPLFGSRMLAFLSKNGGKAIIGRVLTKGDLGIYSRAYNLVYLPVHQLSLIISNVLFSAFSEMQERKNEVIEIYFAVTSLLIYIMLPFVCIIMTDSEHIVLLVLGQKWMAISVLIKIFSILLLFHAFEILRANIVTSQGHSLLEFKFNIVSAILDISAFIIGVNYGLKMIAIFLACSTSIKAFLAIFSICKVGSVRLLDGVLRITPPVILAFVNLLVAYSFNFLNIFSTGNLMFLFLAKFLIFVLLTLTGMYLFDRRKLKSMHVIIFRK